MSQPKKPSQSERLSVRVEWLDADGLASLKLLDLNARFMRHEVFQTLVENVKRDGVLTQVPFAWKDNDGKYLVLSGNHRIKAAVEAKIDGAHVMLCDDPMPRDRRVALQLAHNAISGEDDPATLKELYESLEGVDWRVYSGLDDKTLELLEEVQVGSLSEANLSFETVTIAFLPDEADEAREAWDAAREHVSSRPDEVWLARLLDHERLLDALDLAGKSYNIKNVAVALAIVLGVFERHREDLAEGFLTDWDEAKPDRENQWVPLAAIIGRDDVPAPAAAVIRRALKAAKKRGDLPENAPWQLFELLAADYVAGGLVEAPDG